MNGVFGDENGLKLDRGHTDSTVNVLNTTDRCTSKQLIHYYVNFPCIKAGKVVLS